MPPDLGNRYAPAWAGNPPHMAQQDLMLWRRALPLLSPTVLAWYYDTAVGEGAGPPLDPADPFATSYYRITRKRIDAVGQRPTEWLLVEVRPNAGLGALGAIQTYRSLWERDPPDLLPVRAVLVSDRTEPDVARTALNAGIQLLQV